MASVFSKPKTPTPPAPINEPTVSEARVKVNESNQLARRVSARRGRASTILSQGTSRTSKTYLGE